MKKLRNYVISNLHLDVYKRQAYALHAGLDLATQKLAIGRSLSLSQLVSQLHTNWLDD